MEKNSKYLFLVLKEINGEYEYYHRSVHELPNGGNGTVKEYSEDYLKGFYGGNAQKENGGYYFNGGEVYVEIDSYQLISETEYDVLRRYV